MIATTGLVDAMQGRAGWQASANTETQSGTVTKLYTDALGNVIAADVRLPGIPQPLVRVDNASGTKLWQGAGVTVNWSRGSRFAPYILGAGGAEAGAVLATASAAAEDAALSSDSNGALDLTGLPLFLATPDDLVPDGFLLMPGPNVFMDDVGASTGSGGTVINGKRTISVRPLVLLSLPSSSNSYPDGTLVDLVDSSGNALGMYRWDATASTWRRRDVPGSGGGGGSFGPQSANTFYAGPVSGADALPGFRAFSTASDLPNLSVTGVKLATGAVGTLNLADGAVTGNKLENTGITAGDYSFPTLTVDAKGRITAIASGSGGGGGSSSGPLAVRTIGYTAQANSLTSADDVIEAIDNNNVPTLNLPAPSNLTRKAYYFSARGAAGLNLVTTQNNTIHLSQGQSLVLVPGSDAFYDQFGAASSTSSGTSGPLAHRQIYAGTSTLTTSDDIIEAVENTGTRPILNLPTTSSVTRKFYTIIVTGQAGLQIGSGTLLATGTTLVLVPLPDGTWRVVIRNDGSSSSSTSTPDYRQNLRVITGQSTYQVQDDDEVLICRVGTSNAA